jgi:AcrR family transcriptional regulator
MSAVAGAHALTVGRGDQPQALAVELTPEERVLEALQDCVLRWGVQKTTVEDIARAAGMSRATVYRVFPGGKSSMVEAAALWAALYGHRDFIVVIGADEGLERRIGGNDGLSDSAADAWALHQAGH